jgi:hypothetical protein
MRATLLLALALPVLGQWAQAAQPYHPTMTGGMLVRYYFGPPEQRHEILKGNAYVDRETARGYMDAIKDMTESTAWCHSGGKPHELNADIAAAIAKLKPQDQKGNAAPLVVNALRQLFPCSANRKKP